MKVTEYDAHVDLSDQYKEDENGEPFSDEHRRRIATFGIVSEIGSLISALKKERLREHGRSTARHAKAAVSEEIGDIIWYCFSLARIENNAKPVDILAQDIKDLRTELIGDNISAKKFRSALSKENLDAFLAEAKTFPRLKERTFEDYQALAFKTARTNDNTLIDVCASVLWQLGAELMRSFLPESEKEINQTLPDRPINRVLGEIAWHLSAIATIYGLSLNKVITENVEKTGFRTHRPEPTPLHDKNYPEHEQLPRQFEIQIVTIAKGRSRMYYKGRALGDDLTDNNHTDDGYRFHDVLHLANAAILGWSPVLRGLLKKKRRSVARTDEVEDGARAQIVEEAVLKTIHSEAQKLVSSGENRALFESRDDISFSFLKFIRGLVSGLEVDKNTYWEWREAIFYGCYLYDALRAHGQGTIKVCLDKRTIQFSEHVHLDAKGAVSGFGNHIIDFDAKDAKLEQLRERLTPGEIERFSGTAVENLLRLYIVKCAILQSIGLTGDNSVHYQELDLFEVTNQNFSFRASGMVQEAIWSRQVITFRVSLSRTQNSINCSALAVSDSR